MVSIKRKILYKGKLVVKLLTSTLQDHEDRIAALESASSGGGGSSEEPVTPPAEEEPETPAPTTRNISFTVNDGTDPVEGATVTIGDTSGTTGSAGGCTLNSIADGEQSVSVSKEGFTTKTETITVSADNTSFTISLTASG